MKIVAAVLVFTLVMMPTRALAQDTTPPATTTAATTTSAPPSAQFQLPDVGDFLPLHRGTAAPRDGLLVDQAEMLSIVQGYDRLQHLLDATVARDSETCDVRVAIEHAHVTAAEERLTLRDDLWGARQQELVAQIQATQQQVMQAQHAAERQWWESPIMWGLIGALVASVVFIAVEVR